MQQLFDKVFIFNLHVFQYFHQITQNILVFTVDSTWKYHWRLF